MYVSLEISIFVSFVIMVDAQHTTDPSQFESYGHHTTWSDVKEMLSISTANVMSVQQEIKDLRKQNEKLQEQQQNQSRQIERLIEQNEKQREESEKCDQRNNQSLQIMLENIQEQHVLQQLSLERKLERLQTDIQTRYENISRELSAVIVRQQEDLPEKAVERRGDTDARSFLDESRIITVIPGIEKISGITALNSELFVVRLGSKPVIAYNRNNFSFMRNITISNSSNLWAIVASPQHNSLYISDIGQNIVHVYNLSTNVTTQWAVDGTCYCLSLTSLDNILVTIWNTKQIKEYTPTGSLIRVISLDSSLGSPQCSVQLSSDQFLISDRGSLHRLCIINMSGRIIQCYGGSPGSGVGQLKNPTNIAVDVHGNVIVNDETNNRVVLLSPSLTHLGYIAVPRYTLSTPYAIHLELQNYRLYITEYGSTGRVFVLSV